MNDNHWIYHQQYKYDRIYQPKRKYNVRKKHRETHYCIYTWWCQPRQQNIGH